MTNNKLSDVPLPIFYQSSEIPRAFFSKRTIQHLYYCTCFSKRSLEFSETHSSSWDKKYFTPGFSILTLLPEVVLLKLVVVQFQYKSSYSKNLSIKGIKLQTTPLICFQYRWGDFIGLNSLSHSAVYTCHFTAFVLVIQGRQSVFIGPPKLIYERNIYFFRICFVLKVDYVFFVLVGKYVCHQTDNKRLGIIMKCYFISYLSNQSTSSTQTLIQQIKTELYTCKEKQFQLLVLTLSG